VSRVAVVGAGISGLVAARALVRAGHEVTIFEAADRPGGRIHTIQVSGCQMEAGANFFTDAYTIIPGLAAELGVSLRPVKSRSAIGRTRQLHPFRSNAPASTITGGVLSVTQAASSVPGLARLARQCRGRGTTDPLDWSSLDQVTGTDWARALGLTHMLNRVWAPAINGFYFANAGASSGALVAAMATHGVRQTTLTASGGLDRLTSALAAELDVRLSSPVRNVNATANQVQLRLDDRVVVADAAILAVPGPALPALTDLDPLERAVADVPYSAGLLVGLGVERHLNEDELAGAYGVLLHSDDGPLAALCVASRAGHAVAGRDLVTCLFSDAAARELTARSDTEVAEIARRALHAWAPTLTSALAKDDQAAVVRVPVAMPTTPPGRLTTLATYRASVMGRRVVLAGDSQAWPWSDSAAAAGAWAAAALGTTLSGE
jgi:oxygen-dependent protoporphyrinogen oxidase